MTDPERERMDALMSETVDDVIDQFQANVDARRTPATRTVSVVGHGYIDMGGRCGLCNYPMEFPAHWTGTYTGPWPLPKEQG
jgi:hypothetical protein